MSTIPEPLLNHFACERRELLTEAPAMASVLENIARSLRKIGEAGADADLHDFTWAMESLAGQGMTAKALARSASDLARTENRIRPILSAASLATAADAPVAAEIGEL
jgi:hypothetical protein